MKIQLDHIQRLNLHALLGAQRGDVSTIRAIWDLQDKLGLTPDEESALELKRDYSGGHERCLWNPTRSLPSTAFDFNDCEVARLRQSIESWDGFGVAADRSWLEPILTATTKP